MLKIIVFKILDIMLYYLSCKISGNMSKHIKLYNYYITYQNTVQELCKNVLFLCIRFFCGIMLKIYGSGQNTSPEKWRKK